MNLCLVRLDPEKPCPTIQKSSPQSSTTGLIHPYEIRHLTISEIKLMSSFSGPFSLEGSFVEKWARIGNSVLPLLMKAIAESIYHGFVLAKQDCSFTISSNLGHQCP